MQVTGFDPRSLWPLRRSQTWMSSECEPDLVSVVVPTFNRARFLIRALESVRHQTYRPIEILIVDDGSTDRTEEAVRAWMADAASPSFQPRYIRQPNTGAPSARNRGLTESKGAFIQFLDSDDLLHPDKIAAQRQMIDQKAADFVWSPMKEVRPDGPTGEIDLNRSGPLLFDRYGDFIPDQVCVGLYRRALCQCMGPWDEALVTRQDWDYRYRCEALEPKTCFIPRVFYYLTAHGNGRVNDHYFTQTDMKSMLRALGNGRRYSQISGRNLNLRGRYLLALRIALSFANHNAIREALAGMISESESAYGRSLAYVLGFLYRIAGAEFALRALSVYSALRLGTPSHAPAVQSFSPPLGGKSSDAF